MSLESIALPFSETDDIHFETGRLAKQAAGSVVARLGGTMVLVTVTRTDKPREGADFFPLMVDYREKFYASGRIPGNFFRREGRPGDPETLKARVIDRCLRPLFPDGMRHEVMVYVTIISSDEKNQADVMAMNAASLALQLSDVPFPVPMAAVRVGMIDGEYVLNPPFEDENELELDIIVAGTRDAINMVEAGAKEVSEEAAVKALEIGHEAIVKLIDGMKPLAKKAGKPKFDPQIPQISADLKKKIEKKAKPEFEKMVRQGLGKKEYNDREHEIASAIAEEFITENPELSDPIKQWVETIHSNAVREFVTKEGKRVDGRKFDEIRDIETEVKVLPRAHGSALFVRGSTQALGVATLGTLDEAQKVDDLTGLSNKRFLMHYNFPPWSVGEARPMRGSSRREIGHGALAERALERLLPDEKDFPYTIRVVSEILESNGSSSMATVCAGCLALMDAGIPIRKPVAGIAMGLVEFEKEVAILTDIQGVEDHLGDMDFKVAGTRDGITALQMDIKMESVSFEVLKKALEQAKAARLFILDKMAESLSEARSELSENAPRMTIMKIPVEKIGAVIGPGGKVIRDITMRTGVKIDIQDDGTVIIATSDAAAADQAAEEVRALTAEVELNKTYNGKVVRVTDFGAFVQLLPNRDGLLHISEMDIGRVERVEDVCDVGDMLEVKVIEIDQTGRVRLSRRALLVGEEDAEARPRGGGGGGGGRGGDRDRGPRGGGDRDRGPRGGGDRDRGPRGGGGDRDRGPRSGGGDRDRERPRSGGRDRDRGSGGGDRERGERGGRDRDRESGGGEISYGFRERKRSSRDED